MREGGDGWRLRADPVVVDAVLAATLAVVTVVYALPAYGSQYRAQGWRPFDAWAIGLTLLVHLPLVLRRRAPWVVFLVACAGLLVYTAARYQPSVNPWAPLLACYTVIVHRPARATAAAAATTGIWMVSGTAAGMQPLLALAQSAICVGTVWYFATGMRSLALDDVGPCPQIEAPGRGAAALADFFATKP